MWRQMITNAAKEWIDVGSFESVTAAPRRIPEIEGRATGGGPDPTVGHQPPN